ncbi:FtsK/SpoIIIE domain-containing protein [Thalassoroseus pseudoceratinae]|uniref:FtsK/SpoIIIE domain-containing protein n=1 Tax=Thalassoroseus pseudoceratinae TaxID=2713176 RepID=UPI00141E7125|nr:FtsK/SpoIIIE domain-containing protein [Thalassoroseus pseudoceratinae]
MNESDSRFQPARYRELLDRFLAGVQQRHEAQEAINVMRMAGEDPELDERRNELAKLIETAEQQHQEIESEYGERLAAIETEHQAEIGAAESEYRLATREANQTWSTQTEAVEAKYRDNDWMLSSLLDDESDDSPKREYESFRDHTEATEERLIVEFATLRETYERVAETVRSRGHWRGDLSSPHVETAKTTERARERFDAAKAAFDEHHASFEKRWFPRIVSGWRVLAIGFTIWLAVFAVLFFLVDPQQIGLRSLDRIGWALASGGALVVVCGLIGLILWDIAARKTWTAFIPMHESIVIASDAQRQWNKRSKAELQRREKDFRQRQAFVQKRRRMAEEKFNTERTERLEALTVTRDEKLHAAAIVQEERIHQVNTVAAEQKTAVEQEHHQQLENWTRNLEQRRSELEDRIAELETHRLTDEANRRTTMEREWSLMLNGVREAAEEIQSAGQSRSHEWDEVLQSDWPVPEQIPSQMRLGDFRLDLQSHLGGQFQPEAVDLETETAWNLPLMLPFPHSPSLVVETNQGGRNEAVSVLQVAMLRLLTQLPPGKVRFTVIDPVGLGEPFSAFMHLADYDDLLITNRIWTESAHIDQQLTDLTEHLENVFQKYLRNEFETIEDYNHHAGEVAEPYRILVVAGFPSAFTERAASRLTSIMASGPRCGVYTLLSVDTRQTMPRGFQLSDVEQNATVLRWQGNGFESSIDGHYDLPIVPDDPPEPNLFTGIVRKLGDLSRHVRRVEVPFHRIVPTEDRYWTDDSRGVLDCPLGRSGATKLQHLRFGIGTSQHALVAGRTGSGKSTLLHVLVTTLALKYSPDDIEFYLIDFKKGVEFKTYASHNLPHAKVIAIESDREFGVSTLQRLDDVLKERGELFRDLGVQDIGQFRDTQPDTPMPRILLVVDEFQEFFVEDDRHSQTASLLLDRLVRQGRAFGIHVLLGSQTLGGAYSLARTTLSQMAVRIALQCSEADAHLILSEDNTAARLLTRPGEAIYNDANGMLEGNNLFQVAWLGDEEHDRYLEQVRDLATKHGRQLASPIVFEGNVPASLKRNTELVQRLQNMPPDTTESPLTVWWGEPVSISHPTQTAFVRQAGANVLIVGQAGTMIEGLFIGACLSLAAGVADDDASELPTFCRLTGTDDHNASWATLSELLPQAIRTVTPNGTADVIREIATEVKRRIDENSTASPVFLFIDDVSQFRDLRKAEDDFGFTTSLDRDKPASPGKAFGEVLRDGPAVGIHTIVSANSYNTVDRWFGRQLLREFETRVVFQMSPGDSSNLVDSPAASRLGPNRALLYRDDQGTVEKFRPYGPPSPETLHELLGDGTEAEVEPPQQLDVAEDINEWTIM